MKSSYYVDFFRRTKDGNYGICPLIIKLVIQSVSFLAITIFFGEMPIKTRCIFYFRLFVLLDICSCTYFLPVSGLFFCFLNGVFRGSQVFNCNQVQYIIVSLKA